MLPLHVMFPLHTPAQRPRQQGSPCPPHDVSHWRERVQTRPPSQEKVSGPGLQHFSPFAPQELAQCFVASHTNPWPQESELPWLQQTSPKVPQVTLVLHLPLFKSQTEPVLQTRE